MAVALPRTAGFGVANAYQAALCSRIGNVSNAPETCMLDGAAGDMPAAFAVYGPQ
jgi:hypothetical protein